MVASNNGKSSMRSVVMLGSVVIHQAYQEIHDFKNFSANGQLYASIFLGRPIPKPISRAIFGAWMEGIT
jgi:hypothetical protein